MPVPSAQYLGRTVCLRSVHAGESGSEYCCATEGRFEMSKRGGFFLQHEWDKHEVCWVVQGFGKGETVLCSLCSLLMEEHSIVSVYNKEGRGVQLATRFHVDLEVFWDHQQRKLSLPLTHWKNIGSMLPIP